MSEKNRDFSGDILSSFEHKAKINTGNKNDEVLLREIEEITDQINLPEAEFDYMPFGERENVLKDLRQDIIVKKDCQWLKNAKETDGNYVCVTNIVNKEGN